MDLLSTTQPALFSDSFYIKLKQMYPKKHTYLKHEPLQSGSKYESIILSVFGNFLFPLPIVFFLSLPMKTKEKQIKK